MISDKHWHFIDNCWSADPKRRPSTDSVFDVIKDELDTLSSSWRGIPLHCPPPQTVSQGSGGDGHADPETAAQNYVKVTRWLYGFGADVRGRNHMEMDQEGGGWISRRTVSLP